ncbi:MAG TPA: hypothetical protein VHO29_04075 [Marmoricola sp.]|nr:hypothetical protein [Marmoricola sp.]
MAAVRRIDSDEGWINREFGAIRRQLRELAAAKRLQASTFPAGSVPTTALASPVASGYVAQTVTNFALTTTGGNLITATVTVPSQMTGCALMLVGRVYAANSTAAADYLLARVEISTTTGNALPVPAGATGAPDDAALNVASLATVLTGLTPGGTFDVRLWAKTQNASWAIDAANTADLSGVLSWFAA